MKRSLVVGNWKMHTTLDEARALARSVRARLGDDPGATCVLCPPFIALSAVADELAGSAVATGAQNLHPESQGAFTGEVSAMMLRGLCAYAIVGHSERRRLFGEDDAFVARKVAAALGAGLVPIFCLGETLDERDAGSAFDVCARQLRAGLSGLDASALARVVIAYEPVWAIGTGRAATTEAVQEVMGVLRTELRRLSASAAEVVPFLYGGSVTADNVASFAALPEVDGALVGGASLRAEGFAEIAERVAAARR